MGANGADGTSPASPGRGRNLEETDGRLIVFAQRAEPVLEVEAWNLHAARFFSLRVELAELLEGGARLVVAPDGQSAGLRAVWGRYRRDQDLRLADAAETRSGGGGLAQLARRCNTVWLVERLRPADRLGLQLAAVLASTMLGPILDPDTCELFGANTARAKTRP